jgi:acetylornithine deacetylase ArgE
MLSLTNFLAELVRRPSINPMGRTDLPPNLIHEARVTDYLETQFRELGAEYIRTPVQPGRDNLIARFTPPHAAPFSLLLEAHQDTVPVDGMIIPPFAAEIRDGKLYGRGACDVKAGIAVMFAAFARLLKENPAGAAAVTLAFTVDEEHTFIGAQHLVNSGLKTDFAIVAEPTGLNIVRAHKGVVRWQIEVRGKACHSSRPENGVNAIYRMSRVLRALEEYATNLQASVLFPMLGPPTLSVGMISGGVSPNTVPDVCRVELDRRLLPGEDPNYAISHVNAFLKSRSEIDFDFFIHKHLACPPLDPTGGEEFVERLGATINSVVGSHEVVGVPYGTDASTIRGAGIPAVVFGPGDIAQAHTKDEWIDVSQLEPAAEILFRFASGK